MVVSVHNVNNFLIFFLTVKIEIKDSLFLFLFIVFWANRKHFLGMEEGMCITYEQKSISFFYEQKMSEK